MSATETAHSLLGLHVVRQERELLGVSVELWYAALPTALPEPAVLAVLSGFERDRVSKLRIAERAAAAAWSRALVRSVVGRHLCTPPEEVAIVETERGKPMLDARAKGAVQFNVSHSGQHWLAVLTAEAPVGVDIEARRQLKDAPQLARRAFGPEEQAEYEHALSTGLTPSDAFLRVWTSVEARSKAIGSGIDRHGARAVMGLARLPWCELDLPPEADLVGALSVLR